MYATKLPFLAVRPIASLGPPKVECFSEQAFSTAPGGKTVSRQMDSTREGPMVRIRLPPPASLDGEQEYDLRFGSLSALLYNEALPLVET